MSLDKKERTHWRALEINKTTTTELRRLAEERLHTKMTELKPTWPKESRQKIVHEPEVHQIEIEI
jgi:hypothetical protein